MGGLTLIYVAPTPDEPIRQGDIFRRLPRLDLSLTRMPVVGRDNRIREVAWEDAAADDAPVAAIVAARPVTAIVISQDCDALRAPDLTFCEIRPFRDVEGKAKDAARPKGWMRLITQHARINQKWFYLPPDPALGFDDKMAVDFMVTLCLPRVEIEQLRHLRVGRLNDYGLAHFRERAAEFYRRYPCDEWYTLNAAELAAYRRDHPDAEPYPWQAPQSDAKR